MAVSASEATERSIRIEHDKHAILRDLSRVEKDLHLARDEVLRIKEELTEEKLRYRKLHLEKLAVERKAAEGFAALSRSEVGDELTN